MKAQHLLLLCGLIFNLTAVIVAFSNLALFATFIALGGMCMTVAVASSAKEKEDNRENEE